MATWRWLVLGLLVVLMPGCEPPTQVIEATPPGAAYQPPLPPSEEKDPAQAVGEHPPKATTTKTTEKAAAPSAPPTAEGEIKTLSSGVKYETLKAGTGPEAKSGQTVRVHYTGTLEDGTKFDSSRDKGNPFSFKLGEGTVIPGWDQGVPGMKVGERRKLTIPPSEAYGVKGQGPVPSNATLTFDIELLGIE